MRIYVLSVGINEYGDQVAIPNLRAAAAEAREVYRVFSTHYNAEGALLCADGAESAGGVSDALPVCSSGTRADILAALNEARRHLESEDLFVFFYSGHGTAGKPGYLLPHGAEHGRPGTYLMYRTLFGTLSTLPCQRIMCFLNCCYAGAAASGPAGLPASVVSAKSAVLYAATGESAVTADRLPCEEDRLSPFAEALVGFLEKGVRRGQAFTTEALADHLKDRAHLELMVDGEPVSVVPQYFSSLPAVGIGKSFSVRRPGLGLDFPPVHHCAAGESLRVPLHLSEERPNTLELNAKSRLAGFKPSHLSVDEDLVLHAAFSYPGTFDVEIVARDTGSGEETSRILTVHVRPGEAPDAELDPTPLPICRLGQPYEATVAIEGGTPPFEIEVTGLPAGLSAGQSEDGRAICLHGTVPSLGGGGTPLGNDTGPCVSFIGLHVRDAAGRRCDERRRLVRYNEDDYCLVPRGPYSIGCRKDGSTLQAVKDVIHPDIGRIADQQKMNVRELEGILESATTGAAGKLLDLIVSGEPHAEVEIAEFLIKKYPVTNHDWKRFLDETDCAQVPENHWPPQSSAEWRMPVTCVSYEAICDYLEWRGTRLPTGREWQVAADGGEGKLFPWGNQFSRSKCNMDGRQGNPDLTPADTYDDQYRSRFGTRDMVGNAAEWVDRRVYWPRRDKFGQVFRGGSFRDPPLAGITARDSHEVGVLYATDRDAVEVGETRWDWLGFRDVIDLDPEPKEAQSTVEIPAGKVLLDGDNEKRVPAFRMARYAVSNLEYWEFVRETGHRRPQGWVRQVESGMPFPNHQRHLPVVHVSYLDAHAFCLWKSRKTGGGYRLPSPEQWLAALRGGQGGLFPWGNEFNKQFCNEKNSGFGKPVAVFALPEGCSSAGVFNLVGNVCEWTTPLQVRGGSWLDDCRQLAHAGFCARIKNDSHAADFRSWDVGFRYVQVIDQGC